MEAAAGNVMLVCHVVIPAPGQSSHQCQDMPILILLAELYSVASEIAVLELDHLTLMSISVTMSISRAILNAKLEDPPQ